MEKLILIRFGDSPNPIVSRALAPHIVGQAFASPIPGAIMSIFNTDSSIEQVSASVKETGAYFVLVPWAKAEFNLPSELMDAVEMVMASTPEAEDLTLDDVLDLISRNGIASLTPEQRRILESSN
jgi:hypothetical protein